MRDWMHGVRVNKLGKQSLEVPLHPLPYGYVDAVAGATFAAELTATQRDLLHAKRELNDVHRSKAYRYELGRGDPTLNRGDPTLTTL